MTALRESMITIASLIVLFEHGTGMYQYTLITEEIAGALHRCGVLGKEDHSSLPGVLGFTLGGLRAGVERRL